MALRKYKMEDLLLKYSEKEQQRPAAAVPATRHALPSANEPLRSAHSRPAPATRTHQSHRFGRPQKRTRYVHG